MVDKYPLRIAVTPEYPFQEEAIWIKTILEAGWDYVHLRHPSATTREVKAIIEDISPRLHGRLRLHGHFELLNEFNLGGIHLNSRCPEAPPLYRGSTSRTCHTTDEVKRWAQRHEYVTLSPIFPSISKPGYQPTFTRDELSAISADNVIALGGISPERLPELSELPFRGYAVLGYLFESGSLEELQRRLNNFNK